MHTISTLDEWGVIEVISRGDLDLAEMELERTKVGKMMQKNGFRKILVDDRAITSLPSSVELYQFGSTFWQSELPAKVIVAHVVHKDVLSEMEFLENVAVNRGTNVKTFTDYDDAFTWLKAQ